MKEPKQRLEIRVDDETRAALDIESRRTGKPLTLICEQYILAGLARTQGKILEVESLPEVRAAVREETGKVMAQLYQQLSADLTAHNKRADDRLAGLITKAVRSAGIGQRMIYALIARLVSPKYALEAYEDAKEKAGKDLARSAKDGEGSAS